MTDKFSPEFIAQQRELAGKASARPWWAAQHSADTVDELAKWLGDMPPKDDGLTLFMAGCGKFGEDGNEDDIRIPAVTGNGLTSEPNMYYIVAAANHYPDALTEIERLRGAQNAENAKNLQRVVELEAENKRMKEAIKTATDCWFHPNNYGDYEEMSAMTALRNLLKGGE